MEKAVETKKNELRPAYEKPRVEEMSERDILNTFQVTQAMQTWWAATC